MVAGEEGQLRAKKRADHIPVVVGVGERWIMHDAGIALSPAAVAAAKDVWTYSQLESQPIVRL